MLGARLTQNPLPYRLQKQSQYLAQLQVRLNLAGNRQLTERQNRLAALCGKLDGLSPLKVLARGYSIAEDTQGRAIVSSKQVEIGEIIKTRLADGEIISRVCEP